MVRSFAAIFFNVINKNKPQEVRSSHLICFVHIFHLQVVSQVHSSVKTFRKNYFPVIQGSIPAFLSFLVTTDDSHVTDAEFIC